MKAVISDIICPCCKIAIELILQNLNMPIEAIYDNEITFSRELTPEEIETINSEFKNLHHELVFDWKRELAEKAALILRERVAAIEHKDVERLSRKEEEMELKYEIEEKTHRKYHFVYTVFRKIMKISLVHYFITQKVRRAKQLLEEGFEVGDVADILKYPSIAYFSKQFKDITGECPSFFKKDTGIKKPI